MEKKITGIKTTSDVSLEVLYSKSYVSVPPRCNRFSGYEISLRLRDESGTKEKTLVTTITAETARKMADRLREMADTILNN